MERSPSPSQSSDHTECVYLPRLLLFSFQRLLKVVTLQGKSLSPDPPFCGPVVPVQRTCLPMLSQDGGGGGGFMNGAIWEAGNTANVKIDV